MLGNASNGKYNFVGSKLVGLKSKVKNVFSKQKNKNVNITEISGSIELRAGESVHLTEGDIIVVKLSDSKKTTEYSKKFDKFVEVAFLTK